MTGNRAVGQTIRNLQALALRMHNRERRHAASYRLGRRKTYDIN